MARRVHWLGVLGTTAFWAGVGGTFFLVALAGQARRIDGPDPATAQQYALAATLGVVVMPIFMRVYCGPLVRLGAVLALRGWASRPSLRMAGVSLVVVALQSTLGILALLAGAERRATLLELISFTSWVDPTPGALLASVCASVVAALALQLEVARSPRLGRRLVALVLATPLAALVGGLWAWR